MNEKYLKEYILSLIEEHLKENLSPHGYLSKTNRPLGTQSWDPQKQKDFATQRAIDMYTKKEPAVNPDPEKQAYIDQLRKNRQEEYAVQDEHNKDVKTRVVQQPGQAQKQQVQTVVPQK